MTRMPDIFAEVERDAAAIGHGITSLFHATQAAPQTPAARPATMAAAPAPARTKENRMSLATIEAELGQRIAAAEAAVHDEIGKLVADLPVLTADAKKLAGNPLAQVAITAGEHVISGIIPPEAVNVLADGASRLLEGLLSLYNPQGTQQAPQQPAAPAQ